MSEHSWGSGPTGNRPKDLQQSDVIDPLDPTRAPTFDQRLDFSFDSSSSGMEDVSSLLRHWGQERRKRLLDDLHLDLWSSLSSKIAPGSDETV